MLLHFNMSSLQKNIVQLSQYISNLKKQPEVIAITETKLRIGRIYSNIDLPEYKMIPTSARGVRFYVKETIKFTIIDNVGVQLDEVENLWIRIKTDRKHLILGEIY